MRRFFQFRVTTLLLLVVVCAVALGWWKDHRDLMEKLRDADFMRQALVMGADQSARPEMAFEMEMFMTWERLAGAGAARRVEPFKEMLTDTDPAALDDDRHPKYAPEPEAFPRLMELLDDPDPRTRARAASTLASCGSSASEAVLPLAHALDDGDPSVRWNVLYALMAMRRSAAPAIPALWELLNNDDTPMAVFAARVVRGIEGKIRFVPRLVELLESENVATRHAAFWLLETIKVEDLGTDLSRATPVLLRCLSSADTECRHWAAYELADLAEPTDAIPSLLAALKAETDDEVKKQIAGALFRLEYRRKQEP